MYSVPLYYCTLTCVTHISQWCYNKGKIITFINNIAIRYNGIHSTVNIADVIYTGQPSRSLQPLFCHPHPHPHPRRNPTSLNGSSACLKLAVCSINISLQVNYIRNTNWLHPLMSCRCCFALAHLFLYATYCNSFVCCPRYTLYLYLVSLQEPWLLSSSRLQMIYVYIGCVCTDKGN